VPRARTPLAVANNRWWCFVLLVGCSSSWGDSVPRLSRCLCRATASVLPLRQQSSLLPLLSQSVVTVHRTRPSPVIPQTHQLQSTQSVTVYSINIDWWHWQFDKHFTAA